MSTTIINVRRVYDDPSGHDGYRVFVDRLWPRGESKEKFHYDLWAKDVAPSTELREWFHASPQARESEFRSRYLSELENNPATARLLDALRGKPEITLLYSSRDTANNNATVLAEYLRGKL